MSKAAMNLQDSFLNQVRRENSEVRVLLVNGTLLRGTVKGFDNFTLILNNRNGQHLIYKHAVAQIVTQRPQSKGDEFTHPEMDSQADEGAGTEKREPVETVSAGRTATNAQHREHSPGKAQEHGHKKSDDHSPSRHPHGGGHESGGRNKPKKEGFNKLDLSQVKLGEGEK